MGNRRFAQPSVLPAIAAWAVFAVFVLWQSRNGVAPDTDSAMRLAQVRDLMGGQGWFDTIQHRMNTPYGLPMHWSRLVDAPLALLMLVSEPFAFDAWPLLLFLAAFFLLARIAFALGGRAAMLTVLVLTLLCTEIYAPFSPGDIDHHGVQLVAMLAALLGVVEQRPRLVAIAAALGLGIGLESMPYALAAILCAALWLQNDDRRARIFGITLSVMALLLLASSAARGVAACDTYSLFYGVLLAVGGAGVAAISLLPRHRLAAFAGLTLALLALAAALNPACFAGPYGGMDARLDAIFLSRINEALPVWKFAQLSPSQVVGGYLYAAFALAMSVFAPPGRGRAAVLVFAGTALLVATFQYRAVPFAILFALPGLAAALTHLLERRSVVFLAAAILLGNSAAFTLSGALLEGPERVAQRARRFDAQLDCGSQAAMQPLNALPTGRVAAFDDQGPAVLAYTRHAVISGPYHRDAAGILDNYAIFTSNDAQARKILTARGIDYVMTCRATPDWSFYQARGGLVAELAAGRRPDWLVPAGKTGAVEVYRVAR